MDREDQKKQTVMDFLNTFGSEGGKRVYESLKKMTKPDISIVPLDNTGRIDIYEVMRNEGKRAVMVYIDSMLAKDPNVEKQLRAKDEK